MQQVMERYRQQLGELCREYSVSRLELFGSAAAGDFDPQSSDLDFLVAFDQLAPGRYADTYFGLLEGLSRLFNRRVDLVVASAITNPYFLEAIAPTRQLLYAA